jgi:hypothetical protein
VLAKLVQRRFKVIEDDAVGEAFEDKRKFPKRVDDAYGDHGCHGQQVDNNAGNAEAHAEEQNAETRRHLDDLDEAKLVPELDIPEEVDDGEYPPRIPTRCDISRPTPVSTTSATYRKTAS